MKNFHFAALLIGLLTISLLAGCSARAIETKLDKAEDAIEHKLDRAEDAVEDALRDAVAPTKPAAPAKPSASEPKTTAPAGNPPAATEPANILTAEEAKAIALEHAGFTAEQVQFLRAEYEIDARIPQYDVSFREGPWEYEYEIHAETGVILSFEKDD